ncbi:DUF2303 family protein [Rhizobium skierniewicense]|uniref:DUF2303 family protein n=1 Tax=Rhizobium skierniewicense TaxID=984260 RepID=UPI0015734529|nr:DUF2303 family protein [Rhizobium skierniewicense]NTF32342.1 DUF2303 family protein [Rhizobium skierniewicense]
MTETKTTVANPTGFTGGAIDIETLKTLADKAGSDLVTINIPVAITGVPSQVPAFIDRTSGNLKSVKELIESYRTTPQRKTGIASVHTLDSFIDLVNRHKTDSTVIFANTDWKKPSLTAVIDYHTVESEAADNLKHRILYTFPLSEEWNAWIAMNGKAFNQSEFAEFIEDHITDLSSPDEAEELDFENRFSFKVAFPTQLVELSRGLQVNADTRVKSVVNLQNGTAQILFEEEHQTLNNKGNQIDVPGMFILSIPPFFGGETARIPVRLKYKKTPGGVLWFYQLYRPEFYVTEQVRRDLTRAAGDTDLPKFEGSPEV